MSRFTLWCLNVHGMFWSLYKSTNLTLHSCCVSMFLFLIIGMVQHQSPQRQGDCSCETMSIKQGWEMKILNVQRVHHEICLWVLMYSWMIGSTTAFTNERQSIPCHWIWLSLGDFFFENLRSATYPDTSSTAQGGDGSFKNRTPIGEVGCCESGMAERSHWWTER